MWAAQSVHFFASTLTADCGCRSYCSKINIPLKSTSPTWDRPLLAWQYQIRPLFLPFVCTHTPHTCAHGNRPPLKASVNMSICQSKPSYFSSDSGGEPNSGKRKHQREKGEPSSPGLSFPPGKAKDPSWRLNSKRCGKWCWLTNITAKTDLRNPSCLYLKQPPGQFRDISRYPW